MQFFKTSLLAFLLVVSLCTGRVWSQLNVIDNPGYGSANTTELKTQLPTGLNFLLNPMDTDSMQLRRAAYFDGTASPNTPYLQAADHADFDTVTDFSLSFWINKEKWVHGDGHTYIAKAGSAGSRSWWIRSGSGADDNQNMEVYLYDSSDNERYGQYEYSGTNVEISMKTHVVIVYDGGGAADTDKLKIYFDNSAQTLTYDGAGLPTALKDTTEPITIGFSSAETSWPFKGCLSRIVYWNAAIDADAVAALWNEGYGISVEETITHTDTSTGIVAAWELDEDSGQRTDRSGNGHRLTCPNGNVPSKQLVMQWDEQVHGYQFTPASIASRAPYFARAPWLDEDDANNLAVQFGVSHRMHALVEDALPETSGELFHATRYTDQGNVLGETFLFMLGNSEDTTKYFGELIQADFSNVIRARDGTVAFNGANESDHDLTVNDLFINRWIGRGAGGPSSYRHFVNLAEQNLGTLDEPNLWFGDVTQRRTLGINCLSRSDAIQGTSAQDCGTILLFNRVLSRREGDSVMEILNSRHSVY